jgi:hypothetical protein
MIFLYDLYNTMFDGIFKEIRIVDGEIVKDIELETKTDGQKEMIIGHINSQPVSIIRRSTKHKRTQKKMKNKSYKKMKNKSYKKIKQKTNE